jgi:hypothetical protein
MQGYLKNYLQFKTSQIIISVLFCSSFSSLSSLVFRFLPFLSVFLSLRFLLLLSLSSPVGRWPPLSPSTRWSRPETLNSGKKHFFQFTDFKYITYPFQSDGFFSVKAFVCNVFYVCIFNEYLKNQKRSHLSKLLK